MDKKKRMAEPIVLTMEETVQNKQEYKAKRNPSCS
jgi:hypothetical protein